MAWHETSVSKMYIICHYWYFLDRGFKFQLSVCNDCHDVLMMSIDINNIAILNFFGGGYYCNIVGITKSEAINLLRNADLSKKLDHYKT